MIDVAASAAIHADIQLGKGRARRRRPPPAVTHAASRELKRTKAVNCRCALLEGWGLVLGGQHAVSRSAEARGLARHVGGSVAAGAQAAEASGSQPTAPASTETSMQLRRSVGLEGRQRATAEEPAVPSQQEPSAPSGSSSSALDEPRGSAPEWDDRLWRQFNEARWGPKRWRYTADGISCWLASCWLPSQAYVPGSPQVSMKAHYQINAGSSAWPQTTASRPLHSW